MKKLANVTAERLADYFITYLFDQYPDHRHVRRVASWVGLIVLGVDKLTESRYIPRARQLRFEHGGRFFMIKFNHNAGTGKGFTRGGIDIVEIGPGRGAPELETICSITNLKEAANFYDNPGRAFKKAK